ncbi:VWA domain-containing protein [Brucepastera parasyntrophica]|uniref:VWA domain-containing protein n=1 Tax=Brucepastera parasyntrophica TaxID=2880008 RepID=UPI00210CF062|nr:VWA domain-containing protein [Brucepastera parasyntrophica]ULQ60701.1 VWA domain-containing protein [Brucepastera parasyntrophica]
MNQLFDRPAWLFAAFAVIPCLIFLFHKFKKIFSTLGPAVRSEHVTEKSLKTGFFLRSLFFALSWICLTIAAAGPRWGSRYTTVPQEGSSVVFAMDISRSMTVSDMQPSRLAFAAQYANMLTGQLQNTLCGIVLVKGSAVLAIPLTADYQIVRSLFESLSPALLSSPGSDIASGIRTALTAFPKNIGTSKTIILFTDGDETQGSLIAAARQAGAEGVQLIIVGVGTESGSEINVYPNSENASFILTPLREDTLKAAADEAGNNGLYVQAILPGSARTILDFISVSGGNQRRIVYSSQPVYRYFEFILAALLCFCAGIMAGGRIWRKK